LQLRVQQRVELYELICELHRHGGECVSDLPVVRDQENGVSGGVHEHHRQIADHRPVIMTATTLFDTGPSRSDSPMRASLSATCTGSALPASDTKPVPVPLPLSNIHHASPAR
jgi:hypothetical protein